MKTRSKKLFALMLCLTLMVAVFAGCGGGGSTSTGDTAAPATDGGDSASADAAPSGGSSGGSGDVVSIWHYFEHEADALNQLVDEFNASQDTATLVATYISRDELMNQYTIGAVSGELPDIGMVDSPDMASYISLGVFEDITDELNAWGELDQFYPGPLSSCMDADGRLYGLPNNSNCLALLVNMDMLDAAGLSLPTTWEEFEAVCAATSNPDEGIYGFAMSAISNEEGSFQIIPWLYAAGGSVADLGSAESIRAIGFLADLVDNGYMSKEVVNWGQGDAFNAFAAEKAAMLESGTWQIAGDIPDKIEGVFNYEYTLLPKDQKYASVIGGENFGVCSGSNYRELSIDFLTFMQTAENNATWCEIAGKLPVRDDASLLKDFWTEDPRYAVFTEGMNHAVARGPHPEWPTISKALYTAGQSAILGEKSAEEAMTEAAATVAPILAETPIAG